MGVKVNRSPPSDSNPQAVAARSNRSVVEAGAPHAAATSSAERASSPRAFGMPSSTHAATTCAAMEPKTRFIVARRASTAVLGCVATETSG